MFTWEKLEQNTSCNEFRIAPSNIMSWLRKHNDVTYNSRNVMKFSTESDNLRTPFVRLWNVSLLPKDDAPGTSNDLEECWATKSFCSNVRCALWRVATSERTPVGDTRLQGFPRPANIATMRRCSPPRCRFAKYAREHRNFTKNMITGTLTRPFFMVPADGKSLLR